MEEILLPRVHMSLYRGRCIDRNSKTCPSPTVCRRKERKRGEQGEIRIVFIERALYWLIARGGFLLQTVMFLAGFRLYHSGCAKNVLVLRKRTDALFMCLRAGRVLLRSSLYLLLLLNREQHLWKVALVKRDNETPSCFSFDCQLTQIGVRARHSTNWCHKE